MKVLDLQCGAQHAFEGWFSSEDDFQSQLARGLVECPLCADSRVVKMLSAPRLNLGGHCNAERIAPGAEAASLQTGRDDDLSRVVAAASAGANGDAAVMEPPRPMAVGPAAFLKALRQIVAQTENVGDRFALEARRMHYGEIEARSIRGQATHRETVDLLEEGIEIMPLPLPAALKETLQ